MTSIRKLFFFVLALALTAFALPSSAASPTKIFGLVMSPGTATTASPTLTATFSNVTPSGNSVINAVILTPPTGVTVNSVAFPEGGNQIACPATAPNTSGQQIPIPPGSICVVNIPSVMKAGCTPVACHWAMNVSVTLANTCTTYTWSGQAITGNSISGGNAFAFVAGSSSVTTSINIGCNGVLGCSSGNNTGGTLPGGVNQSGYEGAPGWAIVRGENWAGDLTCTLVPYQFLFNGGNGSASFLVDNTIKGAQQISAEYVLLFNPVPVVAWPAFHPKFAWGSTFGVGGATPTFPNDYVPALACGNDDVNDPQMPNIPSGADPFTAEYAAAAAAGSGNPQYAPAAGQVKMCIANHGWTAMTLTFPNSFGLPAGSYIQPWYKVIDRSDGWTSQ